MYYCQIRTLNVTVANHYLAATISAFLPPVTGVVKVMFSVMCVCLFTGPLPITHDALDLIVRGASERVQTCSIWNVFL